MGGFCVTVAQTKQFFFERVLRCSRVVLKAVNAFDICVMFIRPCAVNL